MTPQNLNGKLRHYQIIALLALICGRC